MRWSLRIGTFLVVGFFSLTSALAQTSNSESGEHNSDFKATTKISLGLTGPSYSTDFQLVDELGLEYDVKSLIEDSAIADSIQLTKEQSNQIYALNRAVTLELAKQLPGLIAGDVERGILESRFREVENEIRSLLTDDQVLLLEQARIQKGVKQFGFPEFLSTKAMMRKFDLNESDLESLKQAHADATSSHETRTKSMIQEANKALIAELSDEHQKKLENIFDETGMQAFLNSRLFVAKKTLKNRQLDHFQSLLRQLSLKRVRAGLGVSQSQLGKIQELRKTARNMDEAELQTAMTEILSEDQFQRLGQQSIKTETTKYGTVNELSHGLAGKLLELTADESKKIFEAGQRIYAELTDDLHQAQSDSLRQSLGLLSGEQRVRIAEILGDAAIR